MFCKPQLCGTSALKYVENVKHICLAVRLLLHKQQRSQKAQQNLRTGFAHALGQTCTSSSEFGKAT